MLMRRNEAPMPTSIRLQMPTSLWVMWAHACFPTLDALAQPHYLSLFYSSQPKHHLCISHFFRFFTFLLPFFAVSWVLEYKQKLHASLCMNAELLLQPLDYLLILTISQLVYLSLVGLSLACADGPKTDPHRLNNHRRLNGRYVSVGINWCFMFHNSATFNPNTPPSP